MNLLWRISLTKSIHTGYMSERRALSIQSHVASGFVGNRVAAFVLQVLGWDVDVVNTVQYSNHAGYGRHGGPKTTASQLNDIFKGMEDNGLMRATRLVTGFIPGSEALTAVVGLARKLKDAQPSLIFLLDPVIGDDGRLYVDPDVVPIYRDDLLHLATVITPNWFEVETLTNTKLDTLAGLRTALRILHQEYKVPNVVISSISTNDDNSPKEPDALIGGSEESDIYTNKTLMCLCSSASAFDEGNVSKVYTARFRRIRGYFSGVGDLFSALVAAHYVPEETAPAGTTNLSQAASAAVGITHFMVLETRKYYNALPSEGRVDTDAEMDKAEPSRRARRYKGRELRLVQNLDVIRSNSESKPMTLWEDFWTSTAA